MAETKFPPFEELERDGNRRIIFPEGYPVDQLPTDEHGLIAIPQGYPLWHEATELNRERLGVLLSGKVNKGDVAEEKELFAFDQLGKIRLIQGVYNADMKRPEC